VARVVPGWGVWVAAVVAALGCRRRGDQAAPPSPPAERSDGGDRVGAAADRDGGDRGCTRLPFAASLPLAEASGAVWLPDDGGVVVVVSDSGNRGAYLVVDGEDGSIRARGSLPLGDGAGDDLEGLTFDGRRLWGLTSAGWMRAWSWPDLALIDGPYPIEPGGPCRRDLVNCGRNFESLCLAPRGTDLAGCAGVAGSKDDGRLLCLRWVDDRLMLDAATVVATGAAGALAACDVTGDGTLWTGDNLFGAQTVRRAGQAAGWGLGPGFPEAMAIAPGGIVYRFSDSGGAPSGAARYRCPGIDDGGR